MKQLVPSLILAAAIFLGSCSSGIHVEKRHYRSGFYIAGISQYEKQADKVQEENREAAPLLSPVAIQENNEEEIPGIPEATNVTQASNEPSSGIVTDTDPAGKEPQLNPAPDRQNSFVPQKPIKRYNGPVEARRLHIMLCIALGLLIAGIILAVLSYTPMLYVIIGFYGITPFLIIGALVLSAIVAVKAKRKRNEYAGKDAETSMFYRRMRVQALAILYISIAIIAIFIIGLVAALVFLSGF